MSRSRRIIIVGGNFAGLKTALELSRLYDVTVIDPKPEFEFLPNIHELLSRRKTRATLTFSKPARLAIAGHRFVKNSVERIEPEKKRVVCMDSRKFSYDICVVAVGGINNTFGIPGAEPFALPFKSIMDCSTIGSRLQTLACEEPEAPIVIVGGGLEGIEALGEILRRYRDRARFKLHLVDRNERLLKEFPEVLDREMRRLCQELRVELHTGESVARVQARAVELSGGREVPSRLTIWTGGAMAPPLLWDSGLSSGPGSWAQVRRTLQSEHHDDIFIIGDAAALPRRISKQAYHALEMGSLTARNIRRHMGGRRLRAFKPSIGVAILSFGDFESYLVVGDLVIASPMLAVVKESIYQYTMTNFDPPDNIVSLLNIANRGSRGFFNLVFPFITSVSALMRLPGVRFL